MRSILNLRNLKARYHRANRRSGYILQDALCVMPLVLWPGFALCVIYAVQPIVLPVLKMIYGY